MTLEAQRLPGTLVVFLIGRTDANLETTATVESKTVKSAPPYADIIPKQKVIKQETAALNDRKIGIRVKAYLPDIVIVEASLEAEDILSDRMLDLKRRLIVLCRSVLESYECDREFDEDYSVSCISGYSGDPEVYLSLHGERIAGFLKNEDVPLDEEEVRATLSSSLKYGRDDITIVDWDGAFIFDSNGDFEGNIELFEIANLQLLRSRMLAADLDGRLEKTLNLIKVPKGIPVIKSRVVRKVLKEIIEIRTQSILESEAVERNIRLIGDWYSAKLYSLVARKFHLESWRTEINEKLDTLEDVSTMASENFSLSFRETVEFVILAGWLVLLLLYIGEFFLYAFFKK